jgi:DNA primase
MTPRRIPFQDIKARAASNALAICQRWLPEGRRQGNWWLARTPWREDHNPSLGVSLSTGQWKEFATGERGDLVDLAQKLYSLTPVEAAKRVAEMLGVPIGDR